MPPIIFQYVFHWRRFLSLTHSWPALMNYISMMLCLREKRLYHVYTLVLFKDCSPHEICISFFVWTRICPIFSQKSMFTRYSSLTFESLWWKLPLRALVRKPLNVANKCMNIARFLHSSYIDEFKSLSDAINLTYMHTWGF